MLITDLSKGAPNMLEKAASTVDRSRVPAKILFSGGLSLGTYRWVRSTMQLIRLRLCS